MTTQKVSNRLAKENSLYLLQHAHNLANRFPCSDEPLDNAKRDKQAYLFIYWV
ncbi:DUF255 domain-containing protein [Paenibacillus polymyxa]|uniref:DUF255 domain-containing protein n=1 Tax=Paenibacillus polymyxa TaxID=1406 RepID=UPI003F873A9C